jgi:chemoreceptor-like protein with four helix bundle sensory module
MPIHWSSILVSVLIMVSGVMGSQTLIRVDQDLRVIYAEYTLAATDLGHVNGELIRYRTSVIRAIEADKKEDFQRIVASLPQKHTRLNRAMERFVEATNASRGGKIDARELTELKAVRKSIDAYLTSSQQALAMMERRWNLGSGAEARRLQELARQYMAKDTGAKFINVTVELDRLLEVVAAIAGEVKKEADASLRVATLALIAVSLALAMLVLIMPGRTVSLREPV